jgi:hypothetical protein
VVQHPDQGGMFADDGTQSEMDSIAAFGSLGFGAVGSVVCPTALDSSSESEEAESYPSSSEVDMSPEAIPGEIPSRILSVLVRPGAFSFDPDRKGRVPIDSVSFGRSSLQDTLDAVSVIAIEKSFPGLTPADTIGTDVNGNQVRLVDISGFYHLYFETEEDAAGAISTMRANRSIDGVSYYSAVDLRTSDSEPSGACCSEELDVCTITVESECSGRWLGPEVHTCEPYTCEPFMWEWPACPDARPDPIWPMVNRGMRDGMENCAGAVPGVGLRLDYTRWPLTQSEYSVPVIGCVDTGILDEHEDLNVVDLSSEELANILPPWMIGMDFCGRHGTMMAGLAAAKVGNQAGIVGVCNNCRLLDLAAPSDTCESACDSVSGECEHLGGWSYAAEHSFDSIMSVHPTVLNIEGAFGGELYWEQYVALWRVFQRQVPIVSPSIDSTNDHPWRISPAGVPYVIGVGGSTWEDKFWTSSTSRVMKN